MGLKSGGGASPAGQRGGRRFGRSSPWAEQENPDDKTDQKDAGEETENAERTETEDEDELLEWSALLAHGYQGILKPRLVSAGNPKTGRITPSIKPITRATTAV